MANLPDLFRTNRSMFSEFFRDLDELFGLQSSGVPQASSGESRWLNPVIDIDDDGKNYVLTVDVPGVQKADLKIDIAENVITISGERREQFGEGKRSSGRMYGRFNRSFTLPPGTDSEQVKANYENGVLSILIPKAETKQRRSIEIQESKGASKDGEKAGQVKSPNEQAPRH